MTATTARWGSAVLGLALTVGTALAQQGGAASPSAPAPRPSTPAAPSTAPAPTTPNTATTSPAALCGLTGQGAGRGGTPATGSATGSAPGSASGTGSSTAPSAGTSDGTANAGAAGGSAGGATTPGATTPGAGTGTAGGSATGGAAAPSAPSAATSGNTTGARLSSTDTCFAQQAALSDLFEIQSSQLARTQGSNAQVKSLAQELIRDHTNASRQLSSLAPRLGLRLPTALEGPKLTELAALRGQRGAAFDRAYVTSQITAHEQAVNLFRAYGELGGANPQLKAHATRTLPVLQRHLAAARTLLGTLAR